MKIIKNLILKFKLLITKKEHSQKERSKLKKSELSEFQKKLIKNRRYLFFLFFPLSFFYMELVLRISCCRFFGIGLLFLFLFSLPFGIMLTILCTFFKNKKINKIITLALSVFLFLFYSTQTVYFKIFGKFLIFYSITAGGGTQVAGNTGMYASTFKGILGSIIPILLYFVPTAVYIKFNKKYIRFVYTSVTQKIIGFVLSIAYHFVVVLLIFIIPFTNEVYFGAFSPTQSVELFGMVTTARKDIKANFLKIGKNGSVTVSGKSNKNSTNALSDNKNNSKNSVYNIMDIDFSALSKNETDKNIKALHDYFGAEQPTKKNEYTGKFKGYNLIMLTAEGFAPYAIDKNLTPTLYKMYNEGFKFTEYYNPPWNVSTSDGEYVECTGLIPKSGVWSFYESGKNGIFLPFSMPQQFLNVGVNPVYGYHNNTYSYYHRDVSHPNLGYLYKGLGNGLNIKKTWPESDKEMIEKTVGDYLNLNPLKTPSLNSSENTQNQNNTKNTKNAKNTKNSSVAASANNLKNGKNGKNKAGGLTNGTADKTTQSLTTKRFHAYYMTVSGHMEYDFKNNYIAYKYRDLVKNSNCSDTVKAYKACNIDLDRALEVLLNSLKKAGVADKTLIALSPDHTPYGLEAKSGNKYKYFNEVFGHEVETQFEVNKSVFLLYSPSMKKPVTVTKPCCPMDIIPTLNNLLGFEYDSRLLPGKDILSNSEGLVVFENHSFITSKGKYSTSTGKFTKTISSNIENQEEYVKKIKKEVNNKFVVCAKILETNYYAKAVTSRKHIKGGLYK